MRFIKPHQDGLVFVASVVFLVVGFLWALGCAAIGPQCELTIQYMSDGVIEPNGGTFRCGSTITVTAIPTRPNVKFVQWGGDLNTTNNPERLLMDTDKMIFANFR
jgi:hypothetical protein